MVNILLITHGMIGQALLNAAVHAFGPPPMQIHTFAIEPQSDPTTCQQQASKCISQLDHGGGVLILTDMFGSTPSNIAHALLKQHALVQMITGLNLPMLFRVINYAHLDLKHLAQKALSGGREGVLAPPRVIEEQAV